MIMKLIVHLFAAVFLTVAMIEVGQAQQLMTVGLSKYTKTLEQIIQDEGFTIHKADYNNIDAASLADKDMLGLWNLRQTWNGAYWLNQEQVNAVLAFVEAGGTLYLTTRNGYANLLKPLGVHLVGNDGGVTGRDWSLIKAQMVEFEAHPLTDALSSVVLDVSAQFEVGKAWQILGKTQDGIPLLAVRSFGRGTVVLGSGERIARDVRPTSNRYETDIEEGDNRQYHVNLFRYIGQQMINCEAALPLSEKSAFKIFPNPTTQAVTILGENMQFIEVLNTNGQVLQQQKVAIPNHANIDLGELPKGLYLLRIKTSEGLQVEEVVLQ